jgi:hypothetical protein
MGICARSIAKQWPLRSRFERAKHPITQFMTDRLKPFSTDELRALIFSMGLAETVEPLVPEAALIRQELIDELKERD